MPDLNHQIEAMLQDVRIVMETENELNETTNAIFQENSNRNTSTNTRGSTNVQKIPCIDLTID